MVVEGLVISVAIGLITGGAGAVAGTSAVVARVAAQSPRFAAILAALRAAVATSTAYLRTTHTALRASRLRLAKFVNARLAMRNEFGHGEFGRGRCDGLARRSRAFAAGHTIEKHVGQVRSARSCNAMRDEPWITGCVVVPDRATAERADRRVLDRAHRHRSTTGWPRGSRRLPTRRSARLRSLDGMRIAGGTVSDVSRASGSYSCETPQCPTDSGS